MRGGTNLVFLGAPAPTNERRDVYFVWFLTSRTGPNGRDKMQHMAKVKSAVRDKLSSRPLKNRSLHNLWWQGCLRMVFSTHTLLVCGRLVLFSTSSARGGGHRSHSNWATSTTPITLTFLDHRGGGLLFSRGRGRPVMAYWFLPFFVTRRRQAAYHPENKNSNGAQRRDCNRCRSHVCARAVGWHHFVTCLPDGERGCGHGTAVDCGAIAASSEGCPPAPSRCAQYHSATIRWGLKNPDIPRARRLSSSNDDLHLPVGTGEGVASLNDVLHDFY